MNVIYGSGPVSRRARTGSGRGPAPGFCGSPVALAAFGAAVATGDFNHDGYSDLAVSAPNDPVGSVASAGSVTVLYGSSTGLGATGNQPWSRDSGGVTGTAADGDLFGQVLAARDFNSDGYTDLAIGIPGAQASGGDAGAVTILYGSSSGLTAKGNQLVNGDQNEHFGSALAAGNFDGSGGNDLAVGAPFASVNGIQSSGATYWLAGSSSGLGSPQLVPDSAVAASNLCGEVLAAYNRDNDAQGYADLAVGCPSANVGSLTFAGAVDIHLGSGAGLGDTVRRMFGPNPQDRSSFGDSLAAADFGRDDTGFADDLVVGQADRTVNGQPDAGRVVVFYQTPGGTFYQVERQGLNGTKGVPEQNDSFRQCGDDRRLQRRRLGRRSPSGCLARASAARSPPAASTCSTGRRPGSRRRVTSSGARTARASPARRRATTSSACPWPAERSDGRLDSSERDFMTGGSPSSARRQDGAGRRAPRMANTAFRGPDEAHTDSVWSSSW